MSEHVSPILAGRALPPGRFLLTAALLSGCLFPLTLLLQLWGGDWLDVVLVLSMWAVLTLLYWLPMGAFLFHWRGSWLTRLLIGYVISVPLYFLTVWLVFVLLTAGMLPYSLRFHPATLGEWLGWAYATPILYGIVLSVYALLRSGGTRARIVQWASAAVFALAWIGNLSWMQSIDSYRWPAGATATHADIVNVKLVDAPHERIVEGQHVRIENGKIVQIIAAESDPGGWPQIDAQGGYLVPGLIDAHVHLLSPIRSTLEVQTDFDFPFLVQSIFGRYAPQRRVLLESGVTTVRDLGGAARQDFALRAALARHELLGPRMLAVGRLVTSPHGHPVSTIWTAQVSRQGAILATDSASLVAGLEQNYKLGPPDAVKIIYGTVYMTKEKISKDILKQAVAWAQARHLMSVVHIDTTQEAIDAVDAGATGIEHVATMQTLPDSLVSAMLAHHTFADPTFGEFRTALLLNKLPQDQIDRQLSDKHALARKLADAGVRLTIGTDAPLVPEGAGYQDELGEFAQAGFTPAQILTFATANNAAYLGKSAEIGSIAADHDADLILVRDNPLANISALRKPQWVMLAGQIVVGSASAPAD